MRGGNAAASQLKEIDMMWGFDGFGFGGAMGIGMLLFWGLIIAAIVVLARGFCDRPGRNEPGARDTTLLDILRVRYAKGEIDKSEFEEKRRELSAQ